MFLRGYTMSSVVGEAGVQNSLDDLWCDIQYWRHNAIGFDRTRSNLHWSRFYWYVLRLRCLWTLTKILKALRWEHPLSLYRSTFLNAPLLPFVVVS